MNTNARLDDYNLEEFPLVSTGWGFSLYMSPRHKDYYEECHFEPFTVRLVSKLLSRYSRFIDIGANYGFFSLLAGTVHPKMEIIAFEPTPETFQAFQRSLQNAGLTQVEACQAAASNQEGTANFNVSVYAGNCSFYTHPVGPTLRQVEVRTIKLDTILADRAPCPTLIKVDVEGHELEVLAGMEETFKRFPDLALILEYNPDCLRAAGHEPEEMLQMLDQLGFAIFLLDDFNGRHYRLEPDSKEWPQLLGSEGYGNLYCVRKENALSVCFFSHSAGLAGAERCLLSTISQLISDHGALCTVVSPSRGPLVEMLEESGATCIESPGEWWCKAPWSELNPQDASRLKPGVATLMGRTLPILSHINPDVVVSETLLFPWGAISAAFLRKPHVWHIHEPSNGIKFIFPKEKILKDIDDCSSLILTCSEAVGQSLFPDLGEDRRRTVYCYIPTPPRTSGNTASGFFTKPKATKLAIFGFIEERKNQEAAVLAARELVSRGYDVELLVAGAVANVDYMAYLQKLIVDSGLEDRVKTPGLLPEPYTAISEADIVLACSPFEGFGRTPVEAMLLSKPVVYANAGGYLESMIDGRTGLSYPSGNIAALADRIASLIDNPETAAAMGKEGHAYALQRFTREEDGGKMFRILLEQRSGKINTRIPQTMEFLVQQEIIEQCAIANKKREQICTQREPEAAKNQESYLQQELDQSQAKVIAAQKLIEKLTKVILSAQKWQKSWYKRIFHRWRPPGELKLCIQTPKTAALTLASASLKENRDVVHITESGLFDSRWYCTQYEKDLRDDEDPILHYLTKGAAQGFDPGPHFSTLGYLELYEDVAHARMNPLLHYVRAGRQEHRLPQPLRRSDIANTIVQQSAPQLAQLDPSKKTVLMVTHEMSRTGAPVLLLNIAKLFRSRFNVVVLALKGGDLEGDFAAASDVLMGSQIPPEHAYSEPLYTFLFQELISGSFIHFAVVNSIVSDVVLKPLWENRIPAIHLIHEFASATLPQGRYRSSAFYSSLQIFPAEIVRQDAILGSPEIQNGTSLILPQGRNEAPGRGGAPEQAEAEKERIRTIFRPHGCSRDTTVIVGMGTVQFRKGVDLFIACAKRVIEKAPSQAFRFVWIGSGFNPVHDEYSLFIADQVKRSGLEKHLAVIGAVAEIETAYEESDILFLSSRLDPLPLVSQDSLAHGKPVICFENASGIAEYLAQDPCTAFGVVPYMDIEEAATRICRLIDDRSFRSALGDASRKLTETRFSFDNYVKCIEEEGEKAVSKNEAEKADQALILQSNIFRSDFYVPPAERMSPEIALQHYMRAEQTKIRPRKPFPGFHPDIYSAHHAVGSRNALAHYIEAGQPEGPWRLEVIDAVETPNVDKPLPKTGLHIHLHTPDQAEAILARLNECPLALDCFISIPPTEAEAAVRTLADRFVRGKVEVRVIPEPLHAIEAFFGQYGKDAANYEIIGHIHFQEPGTPAANFWLENLLGGQQAMLTAILGRMQSDPTIGLVFPDHPEIAGWEEYLPAAKQLAALTKSGPSLETAAFNFPSEGMFWARTAALQPLFELDFNSEELRELSGKNNLAEAIERILPFVIAKNGYKNTVTNVRGMTL